MRIRTFFAWLIAAALLAFALPPHASIPAFASAPAARTLPGVVPPVVGRSVVLGHHPGDNRISFSVGLAVRDPQALDQFLADVNDPSSPQYHQYMSQAQANAAFNPTADQEQAVITWLQSNGITVTHTYPNHLMVDALGTTSQVESLLHVTINDYQSSTSGATTTFYAPSSNPTVDSTVSSIVTSITGLDSYPRFHLASNGTAHGSTPYYPQDYANAYDVNPLWNAGDTGSGQRIGITLWSPPPTDTTLQRYASATGAGVATRANGRLQVHAIDGGTTSEANGIDVEAGLDVETASGMAPGATIDYYEAPTDASGNPTDNGLLDALNAAGTSSDKQISSSWGGCESSSLDSWTQSAENIFKSAASTGHTFFFSSGDNGSSCDIGTTTSNLQDPYPDYPASSPNVTSVGGTRFNATVGSTWPGEAAWAYCSTCSSGEPEGSGGGYSTLFNRPSWQSDTGLAANGKRGYPDIAAVADPNTGGLVCYDSSSSCGQVGGTSLSSPLWAGILADVNQYVSAQGGSVGFLSPALYTLATTTQTYAPFHDVTSGTNGKYNAASKWDAVTGIGTPDVWNMARDLTSTGSSTSTTSTPAPTSTSTPTTPSLLTNGNFESGTSPWTVTTSNSAYPIFTTVSPHSPSHDAMLCGFNSCASRLSQTFTVPSSYSTLNLTYWVYITSQEPTTACYDAMNVQLYTSTGALISTPQTLCNSAKNSGYVQETVNLASVLTAYKGQSVRLTFYGHSNTAYVTSFYVDDVAVAASGGTTSTTTPTSMPVKTATAGPTSTATPKPTATKTPVPTNTPAPTSTGTVSSGTCSASNPDACASAMLTILNNDRATYASQYGVSVPALTLSWTQTHGTSTCVGSIGHSKAMAATGQIWHIYPGDSQSNPTNPNSFPRDLCVSYSWAGENVGEASYGNEMTDMQQLDSMMMSETHNPTYCASYDNHACNTVNAHFHYVGIGVYYVNNTTWLTEDFTS
jgi:subtilase family serine protease